MGVMLAIRNIALLSAVILSMVVFVVGATEQSGSEVTPSSLKYQSGNETIECNCGPHGKCKNNSQRCLCDNGYQENNGRCEECNCGENVRCFFINGVKTCICPWNYGEKDGICVDCQCYAPLDDKASLTVGCTFENETKTCKCPNGYKQEKNTCADIDECLDPTSCPNDTICENYSGSYGCSCKPGYKPIGGNAKKNGCEDIDECKITGLCNRPAMSCVNTDGGFYCKCDPGYSAPEGKIIAFGCQKDGLGIGYILLIVALVIVVVVAMGFIVRKKCKDSGYSSNI